MKNFTKQRAVDSSVIRPSGHRNTATREQLPLRSLPDCLLAAYDEVSRRAFLRFVARGSTAGGEVADWRAAEKDLFLPVVVDFEDSSDTLYALASVARSGGTRIEVAIEDRWLLIWEHLEVEHECGFGALGGDNEPRCLQLKWIDLQELHSVLKVGQDSRESVEESRGLTTEEERWGIANPVTARPFSVVELPVGVDALRSTVVLSDGLIAIRMPKLESKRRKTADHHN
jgi:hypothetical protein